MKKRLDKVRHTGSAVAAIPTSGARSRALTWAMLARRATIAEGAQVAAFVALASAAIAYQHSLSLRIFLGLGIALGLVAYCASRWSLWTALCVPLLAWPVSQAILAWALSLP